MPDSLSALLAALDSATPAVWVCISDTRGSVPRETGAAMLVTRSDALGTIGGGHLEWKAIEFARQWLSSPAVATSAPLRATQRYFPLGPALGQCCGGAVQVTFVPVRQSERPDWQRLADTAERGGRFCWRIALDVTRDVASPRAHRVDRHDSAGGDDLEFVTLDLSFTPWCVWVFGAGHVGRAIVQVLATLPCRVVWVDNRDEPFPAALPAGVRTVSSDDPAAEVDQMPPGADALVLTHSHALDFDITLALLRRKSPGYIGVIGSDTKAATFRKRLAARGLSDNEIARMVSPIGQLPAIAPSSQQRWSLSKHPGVIAVSVASELIERQRLLCETRIRVGAEA